MNNIAILLLLSSFVKRSSHKIIFSTEVEFQHDWRHKNYTLNSNKDYENIFDNNLDKKWFNSGDVENIIIETIRIDLQKDIYDILGYNTRIKINKISYGSITVIFTIAVGLYYGISKYKNFIESCDFIKGHAQRLIRKRLDDNFGDNTFDVTVDIEQPHRSRRRLIDLETGYEVEILKNNQRDGFFYFLLIGFLFLAAVLGILVYHSFTQIYFK